MPDEIKPALTEEERVEKKAKLFRIISRILMGVAVIVIIVFIYFFRGTKQNISQQTEIDTLELRSKLKQIVALEIKYFEESGEYASFKYSQRCKEIPRYDPEVSGKFEYKFDAKEGIAYGKEKDASNDVNGDIDGNDGLTLSVKHEPGVMEGSRGSDFFWTDEEKAEFKARAGK